MGPTAGRRVIAVTLPLLREGKIRHVLVAVMTPESFASVLAAAHIDGGVVGTIVDRQGVWRTRRRNRSWRRTGKSLANMTRSGPTRSSMHA
jgi:hypothetical protein